MTHIPVEPSGMPETEPIGGLHLYNPTHPSWPKPATWCGTAGAYTLNHERATCRRCLATWAMWKSTPHLPPPATDKAALQSWDTPDLVLDVPATLLTGVLVGGCWLTLVRGRGVRRGPYLDAVEEYHLRQLRILIAAITAVAT